MVLMHAKTLGQWFGLKHAKVVRINSQHVVLEVLEGPQQGTQRKAPFDSVEIVDSANPAKKRRVEDSGPAQEEGSGDTTLPLDADPGTPMDAEPKPDSEARKLFGDLGLYD